MNNTPIKWQLKLLRLFCKSEYLEEIEGDLLERYEKISEWQLTIEVLKLIRPRLMHNFEGSKKLNYYGMFKNYFKITWRNLFRQKLYSAINIGGLAIGIAAFMLISIYVQHERSYDLHLPNSNNIYNIYQRQETNFSLGTNLYAVTPAALSATLSSEYPEVLSATTLDIYNTLINHEENLYVEDVLFADEHYFEVFQHTFLEGSPLSSLADKTGAVLTRSFAKKLFGTDDPMGKSFNFWGKKEAFVTGIIEDLPSGTTLQFSCILSIKNSKYYLEEQAKTAWDGNSYYTFITLAQQADILDFEKKLEHVLQKHWTHTNIPSKYLVSGLKDMHLRSNVNEDIGVKGNARQMKIFSIIAIVVLILASINYMNLAIARSVKRAKEVGLRKAIGAAKVQLIGQFLLESVFLVLLSFAFAMILVFLTVPIFGQFVERQLDLSMIYELNLIPMILLVVIFIGIVSGSYPALFMSSLKPTQVLKGKLQINGSTGGLQRILIVLQYSISFIMITLSLVVYLQMRFINEKELGFQKDQILTYQLRNGVVKANIDLISTQLASNPLTADFAFSSSLPTNVGSSTFLNDDRTGGNIYRLYADKNFLDVYEIDLVAGRYLEERDTEEDLNYILNESAVKALGWTPQEAINQEFINEGGERKTIIGVVKDFHIHSMHVPIAPLMIGVNEYKPYISVKISPENIAQTIELIEQVVRPVTPYPFRFKFVDDQFNALYKEDQRQAEVFGFFTILSILVASLGLFGLAAFNVSQRTKEMGIRKVLGASMGDIILNFSKRFMMLVTIAFLLATPMSWYLSNSWLQNFSYRVEISWWMFTVSGIGVILLAFFTISSQSMKVALINPVECLNEE